jgi:hypothetical protein
MLLHFETRRERRRKSSRRLSSRRQALPRLNQDLNLRRCGRRAQRGSDVRM